MTKDCAGIGKGSMTKESLKEMRNQAKLDFECRTRTSSALPMIQMLFLQFFQKQSQEAMGQLSEEDRKKIDEILSKGKEGVPKEKEEAPSNSEESQ